MEFYIRLVVDNGTRIRSVTRCIDSELFVPNSAVLKHMAEEFISDQLKYNYFFTSRLQVKPTDHVMIYFFPVTEGETSSEEEYETAIQFRIPLKEVKADESKPVRRTMHG